MTNEQIAQQIFDEMMRHQPSNALPSLKKLGAKSCGLYAIRMVTESIQSLPYFKKETAVEVAKWKAIQKKLISI